MANVMLAAKWSAIAVFGIIGAFVGGTAIAMLLAATFELSAMGWTALFGSSMIANVSYGLFMVFVMFTAAFSTMFREG
jgi:hypothetical protein